MSIADTLNRFRRDPIDYALTDGLAIYGDTVWLEKQDQQKLAELSKVANDGIAELLAPEQVVIKLEDDRQLIGWLYNRGVSSELIIYNYMWNGHYGPASEKHEAAHMAAQFKNRQVLFLNQPGFGGSSGMPEDVAKALAETGDYGYLGQYMGPGIADWIRENLPQLETIAIYGQSQGALRVCGYAQYLVGVAKKVRVALVDPPGSMQFSLLGLAFNYILKEGIHTTGYRANADAIDPVSTEKRRESAKLSNFLRDKVFAKKDGTPKEKRYTLDGARSLAKKALEVNLGHLWNVDRIDVYAMKRSEISSTDSMADICGAFKLTYPNAIRYHVVQGATHAVTKAKPVIEEIIISMMFKG